MKKIKKYLALFLALTIVSAIVGIVAALGTSSNPPRPAGNFPASQDAGIEMFKNANEESRLRYNIVAVTDVYGPFDVQIYTYSESGKKRLLYQKWYDGSIFIPAGQKFYDWIDIEYVGPKLYPRYNIITAKLVFGSLNAVPETNPSNNMAAYVLYK